MANPVLTFALYKGDNLLRRETLSQDVITVGTDAKSQLKLEDTASLTHAVIQVKGADDIGLTDLGNEPRTLVNGTQVDKCKLHVGDQVQIGEIKIVLESVDAAVAGAPAVNPFGGAPDANPFAAKPDASPFGGGGSNPFGGGSGGPNPFAAAAGASPFAAASNPFEVSAINPFAPGGALAEKDPLAVPDDAPPGTYTYTLVKSGPDVNPDEVEIKGVQSVEVMVLWGTNVLHVAHLTPPRNFYVGEEEGKNTHTDFFIPEAKLGSSRLPVVLGDKTGIAVVLPAGAKGHIELPGQPRMTIDDARQQAQPSAEVAGGHQIALPAGGRARVEIETFVFQIAAVNAGKPQKHGLASGLEWAVFAYFLLSAGVIGGFLGAMAYMVPDSSLLDDEGVDNDQMILIQQYLKAAAEREQQEKETEQVTQESDSKSEGGTGTQAKGESGSMGKQTSKASNKRYAVKGPSDNPDPHIARAAALREAQEFGMIGLLNAGAAGDPDAPTAAWGRDTSLGNADLSARGNMWGDEIGDAFGAGGLGLSGIGEGGGGRGEGIGLGTIGGLGHGAGTGTGQGFGRGSGRLSGKHKTRAPKVRLGATTVSGRLPPEVIQRIVRQNYGRFRMCYEQGLAGNPNLQGRVVARFVIDRNGAVSNVSNGGSDLPDSGVVNCVIRAYYGLSFPQPEGGIVTVVYPIAFSPG